jgi:DNA-binding transcriptional MerR regulator
VAVNVNDTDRGIRVPAKRYRIGELVRYSPFSRQTIHNYTIMGLIREAEWTEGGHRLYDESVFDRLSRIIEMKKTKTLTEIRRILREEDSVSPIALSSSPADMAAPQGARGLTVRRNYNGAKEGEN